MVKVMEAQGSTGATVAESALRAVLNIAANSEKNKVILGEAGAAKGDTSRQILRP